MTDQEGTLETLSAEIVEDSLLEVLGPDRREGLIDQLNVRIDRSVSQHELFELVKVMLDLRPACLVGSQHRTISLERARALAKNPVKTTTWDPLGQFLDEYDLPFESIPTYSDTHGGDIAVVNLNYYISLDSERLQQFAEENTISPTDDGLSRDDDRRIGEFLGYPDAAVEGYCNDEHVREGRLVETVSDAELEEALEGLTAFYDQLDLDYRAFTTLVVPYAVPTTAPECLDRMVEDVANSFVGGLAVSERYGCTVFDQVISDYRERFAPDAA